MGEIRVKSSQYFDRDGGVQDWFCAWGTKKPAAHIIGFKCHLYDPMKREGNMHVADPEGTDSASRPNGFTPLAVAFISLTNQSDTINAKKGTKYAVFPKSHTSYAETLIKAVPKDTYSRVSKLGPANNGWYVDNVDKDPNDDKPGERLYVRKVTDNDCSKTVAPLVAQCVWIDPTAESLLD